MALELELELRADTAAEGELGFPRSDQVTSFDTVNWIESVKVIGDVWLRLT